MLPPSRRAEIFCGRAILTSRERHLPSPLT